MDVRTLILILSSTSARRIISSYAIPAALLACPRVSLIRTKPGWLSGGCNVMQDEFDPKQTLKCLLIAAAPIADATALAAREVSGDVLYQGYGQTEVLPVAMMNSQQWFATPSGSNPLRACGLALPFAEIEIWDEDNQPLPADEVGEIVAKSDGMMSSFWNNPEADAQRIVNGWI